MPELNKYQILYIQDNVNKLSVKAIARHLNVDRTAVEEYIKRSKETDKDALRFWRSTAFQVAVICAVALALRLVYIFQLKNTYFFAPFKGGFDDYIFDSWALDILKGNWLGDPAIFIYRMPLYVYFISAVFFLVGHSYLAVYVLHAVIGTATCLVVYAAGRMLFDRTAGFIAAVLVALYGPMLFFGGMLIGETLATFLACLAFLFLILFQRTENLPHAFFGGLCVGLTMLLRGNMLVAFPLILIWVVVFFTKAGPFRRLLYAAVIAVGVATAVMPILMRNYVYAADVVPIAASGGLNIYIGNAYGADGKYRLVERIGGNADQMLRSSAEIAEKVAGRKLKPSEVSAYWAGEALASIKKHGAGSFAALLVKKFVMFWNSYEFPDIWDFYFFKRYIPVLRLPLVSLLLVVPLAAAGFYFSWSKRRELSLLYVFVFSYMASLMVFFISSRYRLGVMPFLAVLAGYAVAEAARLWREDRGALALPVGIVIAAMVFTCLPVERLSFETSYNSLGIMLKRDGKPEEALKAYNAAIKLSPGYPTPYYNIGVLYKDRGDLSTAAAYFRRAVEIAPDFVPAQKALDRLRAADNEE